MVRSTETLAHCQWLKCFIGCVYDFCFYCSHCHSFRLIMSMHLVGPWLSTTSTGRRKPMKFRSAEHKAQYLREQEEWSKLLKRHNIDPSKKVKHQPHVVLATDATARPYHRETPHIPSLDPEYMAPCLKKEPNRYTGTLIKGIATMHKSNAVPVINEEQARDISKMRR